MFSIQLSFKFFLKFFEIYILCIIEKKLIFNFLTTFFYIYSFLEFILRIPHSACKDLKEGGKGRHGVGTLSPSSIKLLGDVQYGKPLPSHPWRHNQMKAFAVNFPF